MDYALHLHLSPPDGRTRLTPLECEGAHRLLREGLDAFLREVNPPGGATGLQIGVEPYVTHVDIRVPAPCLDDAESTVHRGLLRALAHSRLLTDWQVTSCQVILDPALDPALDPVPDPALDALLDEDEPDGGPYPHHLVDPSAALLRAEAAKVTAFGPEIYGEDTDPDDAALVTGALVRTAELFIDALCDDVALLVRAGRGTVDAERCGVLSRLPRAYRHRYDLGFARSFLAATMKVVDRLAARDWTPPGSLAEALALGLLLEGSEEALRPLESVPFTELRPLLASLRFRLLSNLDHESLYEVPADHGGDPVYAHLRLSRGVRDWFAPRAGGTVHPYQQQPHAYAAHEHGVECAPPEEEVRRVLAEKVGVDPDRLSTVVDLAAIGLTDALWTHSPVMRWFAERRLTDGELLRATMYTTHHVREAMRAWFEGIGLPRESATEHLDEIDPDPSCLLTSLGCWFTDPARELSTGETLAALAGADLNEFTDHAAGVLSGLLHQSDELGLARTLLTAAMQSGVSRYHWWGAPGWPEQVERILALVADPGRREWGPDSRLTSGLPPHASVPGGEITRVALLHRPWTLSPEAAEWCARAAHLVCPEDD